MMEESYVRNGEMTPAGAFDGDLPDRVVRFNTKGTICFLRSDGKPQVNHVADICVIYEGNIPNRVRLRAKNNVTPKFDAPPEVEVTFTDLSEALKQRRNVGRMIYLPDRFQTRLGFLTLDAIGGEVLVAANFDDMTKFMERVEAAQAADRVANEAAVQARKAEQEQINQLEALFRL